MQNNKFKINQFVKFTEQSWCYVRRIFKIKSIWFDIRTNSFVYETPHGTKTENALESLTEEEILQYIAESNESIDYSL